MSNRNRPDDSRLRAAFYGYRDASPEFLDGLRMGWALAQADGEKFIAPAWRRATTIKKTRRMTQ